MSGPSLRKLDAHQSIHEGALVEARHLTDLLRMLVKERREKEASEVADALIEHWELRIISHADSEEEGFYPEILEKEPDMLETLAMLKRDHDILRKVAKEARILLKEDGPFSAGLMDRLTCLLIVNELHSRDEEHLLLGHEHHH